MTELITVPLNRLTAWTGNVRRTGAAEGIEELAASLAAHGQLQSLVVRPAKKGKFEVIAGRRRLIAFQALQKSGQIPKDHPVNCALAADNADAAELSLAENIIRLPMHPLDQFEAFRRVIDTGATVGDVATRFGVTELLITRRLKLARLSPRILAAYRDGQINLETAQAFALSDDHEAQERLLEELPDWNLDADGVRRALTEHEVPSSDKRIRFLGLESYEAAGGSVRYDLFSDKGHCYATDSQLLDQLVMDKLEAAASSIAAEGWSWVQVAIDLDYTKLYRCEQLRPAMMPLPTNQQAVLDALSERYDALAESDEDHEDELADLESQIDVIRSRSEFWSEEQLHNAGALITLAHDGTVRIDVGLVDPEHPSARGGATDPDGAEAVAPPAARGHSAKLIADLTAQRTAAISAELLARPDIALAATVHCLALSLLSTTSTSQSCLQLSRGSSPVAHHLTDPDACKAFQQLDERLRQWSEQLPDDAESLWHWCLAASQDDLMQLLAFITARSVHAVEAAHDRENGPRVRHSDLLAEALQLDMAKWFRPTAQNYFSRVSRDMILSSIDEAKGGHGPALDKMKKAELATRAEAILSETSWIPAPMRPAAAQPSDGQHL